VKSATVVGARGKRGPPRALAATSSCGGERELRDMYGIEPKPKK
jgi:hypothetical protein